MTCKKFWLCINNKNSTTPYKNFVDYLTEYTYVDISITS